MEDRKAVALSEASYKAQRAAQVRLERIGWSIQSAEIDLVAGVARMELRSTSGLLITLHATEDSASLTREMLYRCQTRIGRKGDSFVADLVRTRFLGRTKFHCGVRASLRALCMYLADNAPTPVSASIARDAIRPLLPAGVDDSEP